MDVIVRDYNGNTLAGLVNVMEGDAFEASAQVTDAGNVIVTLAAVPRLLSEEEEYDNEMKADDMRAMPNWGL